MQELETFLTDRLEVMNRLIKKLPAAQHDFERGDLVGRRDELIITLRKIRENK